MERERKKVSELFVSSTTDNCFVSQHQRRRVKWEVTEYTIFQLFFLPEDNAPLREFNLEMNESKSSLHSPV